jgi:hypothetical protein
MSAAILPAAILSVICAGPSPLIDVELVKRPGFPLTGDKAWIDVLKGFKLSSLRIRAASAGEQEAVENRGAASAPSYRVIGVLTDRNRLKLPGVEFTLSDRALIGKWFDKLRDEGISALHEKPAAFGLTSEQLVQFHDQLAKPWGSSTKGRRAGDVAREIVQGLPLEFEVTTEATRSFGRNEQVLDELQGLSRGTVLAALLRPLGLVAAPQKIPPGRVRLRITDLREVDESWPVGWPAQDSPFRVAPALFERLNVEIQDTLLSEALAAIQQRVGVPFLFDHNSLAREQIDPSRVKVSYPKDRTSYMKILDQVLAQARLRSELRVDEAGKPFLWISTAKR